MGRIDCRGLMARHTWGDSMGMQLSKLLGLGCGKPRVLLGTWGPTDDGGIWQGARLGPITSVCPGVPAPWELLSAAGGWDRCLAADWVLASGPTPEIAPEMTTSSTWGLVPSLRPWVLARPPGGLGFGLMCGWGCLGVCLLWLGSIGPFLWSKGPYHYPRYMNREDVYEIIKWSMELKKKKHVLLLLEC